MKKTTEIADDLFERVQRQARKERTTFRSLTEQGLRMVVKVRRSASPERKWRPITRGGGFTAEDPSRLSWERLRDKFIHPPAIATV